MKNTLVFTIFLLSFLTSAYAQNNGVGRFPGLPDEETLIFDKDSLKLTLNRNEDGGGGSLTDKEKAYNKRKKQLGLKAITEEQKKKVKKTIIDMINFKIKFNDVNCASNDALNMKPLTSGMKDLHDITKTLAEAKFNSGYNYTQPLSYCAACEERKIYFECMAQLVDGKQLEFLKLPKEEQLTLYKILNFNTDKTEDQLKDELEYIQIFLPGCFSEFE